MYYEINEQNIRLAAQDLEDDPSNIYRRLLAVAAKYKEANLTPLYIYSPDQHQLAVVCRETLENTVH